jgi:hypothetical protein
MILNLDKARPRKATASERTTRRWSQPDRAMNLDKSRARVKAEALDGYEPTLVAATRVVHTTQRGVPCDFGDTIAL